MIIGYFKIILFSIFLMAGCSGDPSGSTEPEPPEEPEGSVPEVTAPEVTIEIPGTKISQLVGNYDRERKEPTQNVTEARYQLEATDLGVPFRDGEGTWIIFGDTWGPVGGDRDAMAYTTDTDPEDGLELDFVTDESERYAPIDIPGISQAAFEVPAEGVMVNDRMYIYHTTDHNPPVTMGRSVLARPVDLENAEFEYLYDFSTRHFINLSIVKMGEEDLELLSDDGGGEELVIFGSGRYRESNVYLAYQPASKIEEKESVRYFAGVDENGDPLWDDSEHEALPVFESDNPCVGEFSVSYNTFIDRWIMLYNCGQPRGINLRTAENPWGPWTRSRIVFHPWDNDGYCHYIHANWEEEKCDEVHDPGRENQWGGEYGPYQFEHMATGDDHSTTIYFTMSTWNPYTVVLMKARLGI